MPTPDVASVARAINGIVAPAIMISASALMILALQGKYSHLTDRLRSLNQEQMKLAHASEERKTTDLRVENITAQLEMLLHRAKSVRNAIGSLYTAISLFVMSSIVIGVAIVLGAGVPVGASLLVFMAGMVSVLVGTVYALHDIGHAYAVAEIEVRGVEPRKEKVVRDYEAEAP